MMKQNESASFEQENVCVYALSWWVRVSGGFFDEERVFFGGSASGEESKTWNGIGVSESESGIGNDCGVCLSSHLSLFHETWVFPLSFEFSLERVL